MYGSRNVLRKVKVSCVQVQKAASLLLGLLKKVVERVGICAMAGSSVLVYILLLPESR